MPNGAVPCGAEPCRADDSLSMLLIRPEAVATSLDDVKRGPLEDVVEYYGILTILY